MSTLLLSLLYPLMAPADDETTTVGGGAAEAATAEAEAAAAAAGAEDGEPVRPESISAAEWKELSPAERIELAKPDEPEENAAALAAIAGEEEEEAATAATAAAAAAKGADKTETAAAEESGKTVSTSDRAPFAPVFQSELPADHADQVKAVKDGLKTLGEKFRAGEVDVSEYEAEREKLDDRRRILDQQQIEANISKKATVQTAEQRWEWEQDTFFEDDANVRYKGNKILSGALDAAVKDLSSPESLKAHPERANWTGLRFLKEGDKAVRASLNIAPAKEPTAAETAAAAAAAAKKDGKEIPPRNVAVPGKDKIPPSLATLPSAQANEVEGGEFAYLDNLTGEDLERATAKILSDPDKKERYLNA